VGDEAEEESEQRRRRRRPALLLGIKKGDIVIRCVSPVHNSFREPYFPLCLNFFFFCTL